jgi:hypothetical protein
MRICLGMSDFDGEAKFGAESYNQNHFMSTRF